MLYARRQAQIDQMIFPFDSFGSPEKARQQQTDISTNGMEKLWPEVFVMSK